MVARRRATAAQQASNAWDAWGLEAWRQPLPGQAPRFLAPVLVSFAVARGMGPAELARHLGLSMERLQRLAVARWPSSADDEERLCSMLDLDPDRLAELLESAVNGGARAA